MPKTIDIYRRREYGHERIFIADNLIARFFTNLTKRTTLTPDEMRTLAALGLTFSEVRDPKAQPKPQPITLEDIPF